MSKSRDEGRHATPDGLLTVRDVAALLRLTEAGVYSLVAQRKIPHFKISNRVRFTRSDVVAWLERNRVPSREQP